MVTLFLTWHFVSEVKSAIGKFAKHGVVPERYSQEQQ